MLLQLTAKSAVFRANAVRLTISPGGPSDDAVSDSTPRANSASTAESASQEVKSVEYSRNWDNVDLTATPIGSTSKNLSSLLNKASSTEKKVKRVTLRDIVVGKIMDSQVFVSSERSFWFTAEVLDLDVEPCQHFPSKLLRTSHPGRC